MESTSYIPAWNIKQEETEQDIKYALYQQMEVDSIKLNAMNVDTNSDTFEQESDFKVERSSTPCPSSSTSEQSEVCLAHHANTNTYCLTCTLHFDSTLDYIYHMKVFHHIIIPTLNFTVEINDPNHYCHMCKITFTSRSNYHKHLDLTHEMNITLSRRRKPLHTSLIPDIHNPFLYCAPCEKEFHSSLEFSTHLSIVHRMMNSDLEISGHAFECKTCKCILDSKEEYKAHYMQVHRIRITSLVQANISQPDMIPDIEDPDFNCAACDLAFNDKTTYLMHLFDIHDINPYVHGLDNSDEYYDAPQHSFSDEEMHQTTPNQDDANNHCASCKFIFPTQSSYYSHLAIIHKFNITLSINEPEIRYPSKLPDESCQFNYCNICDFTFVRNIDFRNHLARTHDVGLLSREHSPEIVHAIKTPNINNIHSFCSVCEYTFSSKDEYHQHLSSIHKLGPLFDHQQILQEQLTQLEFTTPTPTLEDPDFDCKECNQQYTDETHYHQHLATNHNLNTSKKINPSENNNEPNTKTWCKSCLKCNPLTKRSFYLCKAHTLKPYPSPSPRKSRRITRLKELNVYCKLCDSNYANRLAYQQHMKSVHGGETAQFSYAASCPLCPKKFKYKAYLSYHMTSIHGKTPKIEEKIIINSSSIPDINSSDHHCGPCHKTYKSRVSYGNHLRYKHNLKIPSLKSKR